MNDTPFTYGKIAEKIDFTNRKEEISHLKRNFNAKINTILISPRRWGKSTLVKKAASEAVKENKSLRICHIDIFNIRNENEFYLALSNEVLKATSTAWEDMVMNAKTFLSRLVPRIEFSPDKQMELSFGVSFEDIKRQPDEILDLAENIARKKKIHLVICIDEFQSIASFDESDFFQKKLRSHWQTHSNASYCLYGSKRNMLLDIFSNTSMPFYKFGDLIFLEKIKTADWIPFIQKRFVDTGKQISKNDALLITELADNHPYYVQQLAQLSWFRTDQTANRENILSAHESLIDQLSLLFAKITEDMPTTQVNLLKAIIANEKQLSAKDTIKRYQLGTSANVSRLKKKIIEEEIVEEKSGNLLFLDPMYQYWFKTRLLNKH